MKGSISHDWSEETPEAKARWFQSLTLQERMEVFCEFYELAIALNPNIAEARNAQPTDRRIQIIRKP